MESRTFERQLREDGFRHVYTWQDGAHSFYPDHTHAVDTAHVVLDGEMTLTCEGTTKTYTAGERPPDIPAGTIHSARMGPAGCRYLVGV
jgi:mannose-6-phosphate isomerase-like protein (cupin superfamily)